MTLRADTLIVDGRHLLWRAADVHSDLSAPVDGVDIPTGGIYGFLSVLIRVHARYGGHVVVTWEGQGRDDSSGGIRPPNFRFELYPAYKKKDQEIPSDQIEFVDEMIGQECRLKLMLQALGVKQYMGIGCEGDDVTGRLAREESEAGRIVVIYSGDGDLHQLLVYPNVYVAAPNTVGRKVSDRIYGNGLTAKQKDDGLLEASEKHGVPVALLAALKALIGGKDNLPGVPGVGKKWGTELLNHYGSLTSVLRAARSEEMGDWPLTPRLRGLVASSALDVIRYYKVAQIQTNVDIELIAPVRNQKLVLEMLRVYRFQSLAAPAEFHALMALA